MSDEFSDIGSVKALLSDARERIKESEARSTTKINEVETRLITKIDELDAQLSTINLKIVEWLPLLTNLSKTEENKRNMSIMLLVAFISNVAAWILTIFIYFIKSGVMMK
jgi:hypothetical protein